MSTITPDTTKGDKLLEKFYEKYNEILKDIQAQTDMIGLNDQLINKILILVGISKELDPPTHDTLKVSIMNDVSKLLAGTKTIDEILKQCGSIDTKIKDELRTALNGVNIIQDVVTIFNANFFNDKSTYKVDVTGIIFQNLVNDYIIEIPTTTHPNNINFVYNANNILVFIGKIIEELKKIKLSKKKTSAASASASAPLGSLGTTGKFSSAASAPVGRSGTTGKYKYSSSAIIGGSIFVDNSIYSFTTFNINYFSFNDEVVIRIDAIEAAQLLSSARKTNFSCASMVNALKSKKAIGNLTKLQIHNNKVALTANPCAGLTPAKSSIPATSNDCKDLKDKLGLSVFKPRDSTINASNWGAIQKSANLINLRSDSLDCDGVLDGMRVFMIGGSNYVMEGGDINSLRGLKDVKETMPMPSFSGQVVDMAVKLLEGLRRSNIKVDDSVFTNLETEIKTLKDKEKEVFDQLSKLKEIVDLSSRVSGGEEQDLPNLDDSTVDTLKDKLKEDIRKLLKRSECMQRLIIGASFRG